MKFQPTFGETVKYLREERNLTLREVAKKINIDTSMLGKIEKNKRRASKLLIKKIAKFFNVDDKELKIAFLSDQVVYGIAEEKDSASEILKVAVEKVKYLISKKLPPL